MPLPMINISNVHNNTGLDEKRFVNLTRIGPPQMLKRTLSLIDQRQLLIHVSPDSSSS